MAYLTAIRKPGGLYCAAVFLFFLSINCYAQSDAEKFAEAQAALKHKDCNAALEAFNSVSAEGKQGALWSYYVAQTYECLNDLSRALKAYEDFNSKKPGQPDVIEKIGELRYLVRKQEELQRRTARLSGRWMFDLAASRGQGAENARQNPAINWVNQAIQLEFDGAKLSIIVGEVNRDGVLVYVGKYDCDLSTGECQSDDPPSMLTCIRKGRVAWDKNGGLTITTDSQECEWHKISTEGREYTEKVEPQRYHFSSNYTVSDDGMTLTITAYEDGKFSSEGVYRKKLAR